MTSVQRQTSIVQAVPVRALFGSASDGMVVVSWASLLAPRPRLKCLRGVAPGTRVVVPLAMHGTSVLGRLLAWSRTVVLARLAERRLIACGISLEGRFAGIPHLSNPTFLYELRGGAARYALRYLVPEPSRGLAAGIRRLLAGVTGYPTSLGGVVVVGTVK